MTSNSERYFPSSAARSELSSPYYYKVRVANSSNAPVSNRKLTETYQGVPYQLRVAEVPMVLKNNRTVMVPSVEAVPYGRDPYAAISSSSSPLKAPSSITSNVPTSSSNSGGTASSAPSSSTLSPFSITPSQYKTGTDLTSSASHTQATLSTAGIVGICIGAVVFLALLALLLVLCCRKKRRSRQQDRLTFLPLHLESAAVPHMKERGRGSRLAFLANRKKNKSIGEDGGQEVGQDRANLREQNQLVGARAKTGSESGVSSRSTSDSGFRALSSDDGHADDKTEGGEGEVQEQDPTMQTFKSYFESKGSRPLPGNYHTLHTTLNPFAEEAPSLPYYNKAGRLSTGLGLTPKDTQATTVPPLLPHVPNPSATARNAQEKRPKTIERLQLPPTSSDRPTIRVTNEAGGSLSRGGTGSGPLEILPLSHFSRETTAVSVYSKESAQENREYGNMAAPRTGQYF